MITSVYWLILLHMVPQIDIVARKIKVWINNIFNLIDYNLLVMETVCVKGLNVPNLHHECCYQSVVLLLHSSKSFVISVLLSCCPVCTNFLTDSLH